MVVSANGCPFEASGWQEEPKKTANKMLKPARQFRKNTFMGSNLARKVSKKSKPICWKWHFRLDSSNRDSYFWISLVKQMYFASSLKGVAKDTSGFLSVKFVWWKDVERRFFITMGVSEVLSDWSTVRCVKIGRREYRVWDGVERQVTPTGRRLLKKFSEVEWWRRNGNWILK